MIDLAQLSHSIRNISPVLAASCPNLNDMDFTLIADIGHPEVSVLCQQLWNAYVAVLAVTPSLRVLRLCLMLAKYLDAGDNDTDNFRQAMRTFVGGLNWSLLDGNSFQPQHTTSPPLATRPSAPLSPHDVHNVEQRQPELNSIRVQIAGDLEGECDEDWIPLTESDYDNLIRSKLSSRTLEIISFEPYPSFKLRPCSRMVRL